MKIFKLFSMLIVLSILLTLCLPVAYAASSTDFSVDATAALLVDTNSGMVLYAQNADARIYPASLTKIITTMLILEYGHLDETATVSQAALSNVGDQSSTLLVGEMLTLDSLVYLIMVSSVNEACNVAAEHIAGSIEAFVDLMNEKASSLGCTDTHFSNTHGLHADDHYSTANDLYLLTLAAMETDGFMTYVSTDQITLPATNLSAQRTLIANHYLDGQEQYYESAQDIKGGYTSSSGYSLISMAQNGSLELLCILCGAELSYAADGSYANTSVAETKNLLEYGFSSYGYQTVLNTTDVVTTVPALFSSGDQQIRLVAATEISALLPLDYDKNDLIYDITLNDPDGVEAPTALGAKLGTVTIRYQSYTLGSAVLIAANSVNRSEFAYASKQLRSFLSNIYIKFIIAVLIAVIILFLIHEIAHAPHRAYYKRLRKWKRKQDRQTAKKEN